MADIRTTSSVSDKASQHFFFYQVNFVFGATINLKKKKDANTEETWSNRAALRYTDERLDATLSYYYQDQEIGARQINHRDAFGTGK